jgi:DNA-binding transcriptional MerR regulator
LRLAARPPRKSGVSDQGNRFPTGAVSEEDPVPEGLRIGHLAEIVGVNPKTIRYYEDVGILPAPRRSEAGYRLFGQQDADRLRFVRGARLLGMSLRDVHSVLAARDRGQAPCTHVLTLIDDKLVEVDEQIVALTHLREELSSLRDEGRRLLTNSVVMRDCVCQLIGRRVVGLGQPG